MSDNIFWGVNIFAGVVGLMLAYGVIPLRFDDPDKIHDFYKKYKSPLIYGSLFLIIIGTVFLGREFIN